MSYPELEIQEKNRFTATESITLIPVTDIETYREFLKMNDWVTAYFPNFEPYQEPKKPALPFMIKKILQNVLNGKTGNKLENFSYKLFKRYQKRKYAKKLDKESFLLAFKSGKNISKHHPQNFQIKTIKLLNEKIKRFNREFNMNISLEEDNYE